MTMEKFLRKTTAVEKQVEIDHENYEDDIACVAFVNALESSTDLNDVVKNYDFFLRQECRMKEFEHNEDLMCGESFFNGVAV